MNWLENTKILIADDDEGNRELAKIYLKNIWIEQENIVTAIDWLDALKTAKEQLFDIIIMDIGMPFMDGKKAAKEIRSIYNLNSPKIIAYTANNEQKMINDTENKELFDDIIIKPAIRDIFKKTILRNLNIQNKDNT